MEPKRRNSKLVFHFRVDIHVVGRTGKRRSLNLSADRRGIIPLDIFFKIGPKALQLLVIPGEAVRTSVGVHGVTSNELLLTRVREILPARHPGNRGVGNIIWATGLPQELGKATVGRRAIEMVAKVSAQLPARIGDSRRPDPRL